MQSTIVCTMTSYGWRSLEIPCSRGMSQVSPSHANRSIIRVHVMPFHAHASWSAGRMGNLTHILPFFFTLLVLRAYYFCMQFSLHYIFKKNRPTLGNIYLYIMERVRFHAPTRWTQKLKLLGRGGQSTNTSQHSHSHAAGTRRKWGNKEGSGGLKRCLYKDSNSRPLALIAC